MIIYKRIIGNIAFSTSSIITRSIAKFRGRTTLLPKEIIVTGIFNKGFGISIAAEATAEMLEKNGFTVLRHDASALFLSKRLLSHDLPGNDPSRAWLIHLNPPEALAVINRINPAAVPSGPKIGYWAWELEIAPPKWELSANYFDIIFTPSVFCLNALRHIASNICFLPHPILKLSKVHSGEKIRRSRNRFQFYIQADGNSSVIRKNALAAIRAYKIIGKNSRSLSLIIKLQNTSEDYMQNIFQELDGIKNFEVINENLSSTAMKQIQRNVNCVVSAHRSEGYGLALAQAAAKGTPVVATGWSGNMDYMADANELLAGYKLVSVDWEDQIYGHFAQLGARWADVNTESLAERMEFAALHKNGAPLDNIIWHLNKNESIWDTIQPGYDIKHLINRD